MNRVFKYLNGTRKLRLTYPRSKTPKKFTETFAGKFESEDCRICRCWFSHIIPAAIILGMSSSSERALYPGYPRSRPLLLSPPWIPASINLYGDNQSAQNLVSNPVLHQRSKHIDIHFHYTREKAQEGALTINHISSSENPADLMTKGLPRDIHNRHLLSLKCTVWERVLKIPRIQPATKRHGYTL